MYKPTLNSYFSGAGLLDIGLMEAGIDIQQSYELDKVACEVQRHNLGDHVVQSDLSEKVVKEDFPADVMAFTYPCTKYSTIGDIHGVRTGDELYLHALRHIAVAGPEVFVVENVPGMKKFRLVMEAMSELDNYYTQVFCPVKTEMWLPQRRDRLIIIASKKPFNWRPPENKGKRVELRDIIEENPDVTWPSAIRARMNGEYRDLPIISDPEKGDIAPTAVAHYRKDKGTRVLVDKRYEMGVRPYSVREFARLQGVPDWFEFICSNTNAYKVIGNGVSIPTAYWVGTELLRYFNRVN